LILQGCFSYYIVLYDKIRYYINCILYRRTIATTTTGSHNFTFGVGEIYAESPYSVAAFKVNLESHTGGASLGPLVCGANKH
jgi:hypothetical protein